jgi:hypothetical protein
MCLDVGLSSPFDNPHVRRQGNIRVYLSIFKHIRGILKKNSKNISNMSDA